MKGKMDVAKSKLGEAKHKYNSARDKARIQYD